MAITISPYNHTAKILANKEIVYTTLKVVLLNGAATFNPADTALTDVTDAGANDVDGNGWDVGGEPLANEVLTIVNTNQAKLDADDLIVAASGGSIGPAEAACIYDDSHASDAPLFWIEFNETFTATVGNNFQFIWAAEGIARWLVA